MSWTTNRLVEFQHCDPAGIVFYPRYFEMINSVIEEYFRVGVGYSFGPMHFEDARGVPTVKISAEFQNPSHLEDMLEFSVDVPRIGASSVDFEIIATCNGQPRLRARSTLVRMDLNIAKSEPWPQEIRDRLNNPNRRPQ